MTRKAPFITVVALAIASALHAANFAITDTINDQFPIDQDGTVTIENPIGNIEVVGGDFNAVIVSAQKVIRAIDNPSLGEGRDQVRVEATGNRRNRILRTTVPTVHATTWGYSVTYFVRVPRGVQVKIVSSTSDHVRVLNVAGNVSVKNVNGTVILENLAGPLVVDSINGSIIYAPLRAPLASVQLSTINGQIQVAVARDAIFQWIAETLTGDFLTTLPVVGGPEGPAFHYSVNAPNGPLVKTRSTMGNIIVIAKGATLQQARSLRRHTMKPTRSDYEAQSVDDVKYSTRLGDVNIGQVRGGARIETGAGEIRLGVVRGDCNVISHGGPVTLGDVFGTLSAHTDAGDVTINAARSGGTVTTGGGTIRVLYAAAPTTLRTDGGDIIVRQTSAGVNADTRSGDISIALDPSVRTAPLVAKTSEGNVLLALGPGFGADIDATVITSDADSDAIRSEFPGLMIRREQAGNKVRIRATGKINGGGNRVEIFAQEGTVEITTTNGSPLISPRY